MIRAAVFSAAAMALLALACARAADPPPRPAATAAGATVGPMTSDAMTSETMTSDAVPADAKRGRAQPADFATIVQRSVPGQSGAEMRRVARDDAAWRLLWVELREGAGEVLSEKPPVIDFGHEMAIVAAMPTQGCVSRVTIQSIVQKGGPGSEIAVTVLEAPPAPGCRCMVSSRPVHAVHLPRLTGPVRFVAVRGQTPCGP
jgi:hypothetical protein